MWSALSDKRMGLLFTIAAGPRQRSHSRVWVLWDSQPYCDEMPESRISGIGLEVDFLGNELLGQLHDNS
jgi:hypothetical protein